MKIKNKINKENRILVILLILCILFLFEFVYVDERLKSVTSQNNELNSKITELTEKINDIKEEDTITRALLNAHLTNQLSKDYGGEVIGGEVE